MRILDSQGNEVATCNIRTDCNGTAINEDGKDDPWYEDLSTFTYDINQNDCCAVPANPYFTLIFDENRNLSSLEKFNILNLVLYRLYYDRYSSSCCCASA